MRRTTPVSFQLAIQDMQYVVLCLPAEHNGGKAFTACHCQLYCQKTLVSVLARFYQCQMGCWWCLQGFCMPFSRDGYRLVFIRYRYITDTFKTIPVPKRKKKLRLTTFKKGFFYCQIYELFKVDYIYKIGRAHVC